MDGAVYRITPEDEAMRALELEQGSALRGRSAWAALSRPAVYLASRLTCSGARR